MRYIIYVIAILQTAGIIVLLNELDSHGYSSTNMRSAYYGACEISKRVSSVTCDTAAQRFKDYLDNHGN